MLALFLGACAPNQRPLKTVSPTISEPESSVRADASAIAYVVQAERFFIQERFQKAADHYRLALIHDPYSAELHLRLARSLGQLNQWLSALKVLEKGVRAQPNHIPLRLALGRLYVEVEDYEQAEATLMRIGPTEKEFEQAWTLRLESALWTQSPERIQALGEQGLQEYPELACTMARLMDDHGRESWARSYFERCTESTVRDRLRIEFRDQGGELSSRFETIESPEKLNLQRNTSVINSDEQRRRGVELRRAHRLEPGNCFVLCQLGHWYGANEEQLRSRRYLEEAYRRCPNQPAIALALAWSAWSQGERERAVSLSRWVLEAGFDEQYCNEARKVIELSDEAKLQD